MSIAARFYVRSVEKFAHQGATPTDPAPGWAKPAPIVKVTLDVVSGNRAPENQQWASATPAGQIIMTVGNPEAAAEFEEWLGEDIAVTFTRRDPAETASD